MSGNDSRYDANDDDDSHLKVSISLLFSYFVSFISSEILFFHFFDGVVGGACRERHKGE